MRILRMAAGPLALFMAIAPLQSNAQSNTLPVPLISQLGYNWCWAASDQMVLSYYHWFLPQCLVATIAYPSNHCCPAAPGGQCDMPSTSHIGAFFPATQIRQTSEQFGNASLSFSEIVAEIDAGRPFIFSRNWPNGGHLMVGRGYLLTGAGTSQWVYRNTSIGPDASYIRYEEYVGGPDWGFWNGANFYNIH